MTEDTVRIMELEKRVVTLEQLLHSLAPIPLPTAASFPHQRIINAVANWFSLAPCQLVGKRRTAQVAWPRHIAMHLIYKYCDQTLTETAALFNRDHTTVLHATNNVKNRMDTEPRARDLVLFLESQLENQNQSSVPSVTSC